MKIRPLDDRVVVEPLEAEEKTAGGILLPDTAKEKPQRGHVLAVGPGKLLDTGERRPLAVVEGRRGPLRQVRRHRHQGRRQGDQDPARDRHPGEGRQVTMAGNARVRGCSSTGLLNTDSRSTPQMAKQLLLHRRRPQEAARRAPTSWPRPSASRSGRPAATSSSTSPSAARPSPRTASPSRKEIDLPDPFENMGAKLVNAVAQKTSDVAGDGTTTATILALSIYQEGLRNITAGANPMAVKRGIDKAVDAAVDRAARQAVQAALQEGRDGAGRHHLAPTTTRPSAS